MGMKLEHAINPFASVSRESNIGFSVQFCVNDWKFQKPRKLIKQKDSMDRFLDRQNAESIKKTMQAQEENFKHQVRELHRVYSVQKMLTDELQKERKRHWNNQPNLTSQSMAFGHNNSSSNKNSNIFCERERGGSCSDDDTMMMRTRKDIDIDLERPADHQGEASAVDVNDRRLFNKMRMNGCDIEESELELTLSIGLSPSSSKSYQMEINRELDSSASFKSDNQSNNQDCSGSSTPMSSSRTTLDQEKKRPHWLFQGLSINRS